MGLEVLEQFWLAQYLRRSLYAYPLVNALHILALGGLVTSVLLMDVRVLGLGARLPLSGVIALLRPLALSALALAAVTGLLLFSVQPLTYVGNPVFWTKMGLLGVALANAGVFTLLGLHESPGAPVTRAMAALSMVLWIAVLLAGRAIAYFGVD